ncbi:proline dehydrogenase 2, mitochondrial [Quercus suber]
MAARVFPPRKLLKSFGNCYFFSRPFNSSSSSPSSSSISINHSTEKLESIIQKQPPPTNTDTSLNLHDVEKLFSSVPTTKLLRASANLHFAAMESMVDFGMWVMKSKLMEIWKRTVASQIGDTHTAFEIRAKYLRGFEILLTWILLLSCVIWFNYDNNMKNELPFSPFQQVSFVIVKISAICPMNLLERVSDLLRWQHKNPSFNLPWKLDTLPILSSISPTYHTLHRPEPLTLDEEHDFQLAHQRLLKICQKCLEANVPLTIDAEHTPVQPAIDYFTYSSAIMYNRDDNIIMYGTIQAYLKDAKERLLLVTKAVEKMGIPMGFKLVRGAYMSYERKLASSLGFESPIHNSIQETHACYNDCASFMLDKIANGPGALVLATHNVESGKKAVAKAHDLGVKKVNQKLEFAQLYGMSEALSFGLRNAGFQVSKYMPFGTMEIVIPYLLRRAEENRGPLSALTLDRQLIRKELKRRLKATVF